MNNSDGFNVVAFPMDVCINTVIGYAKYFWTLSRRVNMRRILALFNVAEKLSAFWLWFK